MFYVIALAGAHKRVINQLREQLVMVGLLNRLLPCIESVLLREFNICGIVFHQEGRDKRFLIQKLCQAQKVSVVRSPLSNPRSSSSSSSYHTSFSNNFSESVFLAHPPPDSATHVWDTAAHPRTRQICSGTKLWELLSPTYFLFCIGNFSGFFYTLMGKTWDFLWSYFCYYTWGISAFTNGDSCVCFNLK